MKPSEAAMTEAKQNPGGWVYEIDGEYGPEENVPPEVIKGAWKVDDQGNIVGEFLPNPNYRPATDGIWNRLLKTFRKQGS